MTRKLTEEKNRCLAKFFLLLLEIDREHLITDSAKEWHAKREAEKAEREEALKELESKKS